MKGFGIGAFIAAGAAQGIGAGLVEDARQKREERLKQIERDTQAKRDDLRFERDKELRRIDAEVLDRRLDKTQGFQAGQAREERDWRSGEAATDRGFRAGESEADRKARAEAEERRAKNQGEYGTTSDGKTLFIQGDRARPVKGEDDQPIRGVTRGKVDGEMSATEKRLRFKEGLDAGKGEYTGAPHDWRKSVQIWNAYGIEKSDPRVVEMVTDDLRAQAGKKGLKGEANNKFVNDKLMELGIGVNNPTENLKAPGPTAPTMKPSGGGFSAADPNARPALPPVPSQPGPASGGAMDQQRAMILEKARAAIAQGAPREAVIQRLKERNIDPTGL